METAVILGSYPYRNFPYWTLESKTTVSLIKCSCVYFRAVKHVLDALQPYTKENGGLLKVEHVTYVEGRGNVIIEYDNVSVLCGHKFNSVACT